MPRLWKVADARKQLLIFEFWCSVNCHLWASSICNSPILAYELWEWTWEKKKVHYTNSQTSTYHTSLPPRVETQHFILGLCLLMGKVMNIYVRKQTHQSSFWRGFIDIIEPSITSFAFKLHRQTLTSSSSFHCQCSLSKFIPDLMLNAIFLDVNVKRLELCADFLHNANFLLYAKTNDRGMLIYCHFFLPYSSIYLAQEGDNAVRGVSLS